MMGVSGFMSKFTKADFEDANMKYENGIASARIRFSLFMPRFQKAQTWLDKRIDEDMRPYIPVRTGALREGVHSVNISLAGSGRICVYTKSYGRRVYSGISESGKPMHYRNPLSTPHWFNTVKNIYQQEWIEGAKKIVKEGDK